MDIPFAFWGEELDLVENPGFVFSFSGKSVYKTGIHDYLIIMCKLQ